MKPDRYFAIDRDCAGTPLYDGADYGKDKPQVFDEDSALECVERLNEENTEAAQ